LLNLRQTVSTLVGAIYATKHHVPWPTHWREWRIEPATLSDTMQRLGKIAEHVPGSPLGKGHPDTARIRSEYALSTQRLIDAGGVHTALASARQLAALDMRDGEAFHLFGAMLATASETALSRARTSLKPWVVMHVTCEARIERARESMRSFETTSPDGFSQIIVLGRPEAHAFAFDVSTRTLIVPSPDTYEHLPAKVIAAMAFLAMCANVEAVLKVDDDHRLRSAPALLAAFRRTARPHPLQAGEFLDAGALGLHARTWHFGKTSGASVGERPFTYVGPSRWANGASGYLINKLTLRLMYWSYVYFQDAIDRGLYEDMTISDLIERQGGRLVQQSMAPILGTVGDY